MQKAEALKFLGSPLEGKAGAMDKREAALAFLGEPPIKQPDLSAPEASILPPNWTKTLNLRVSKATDKAGEIWKFAREYYHWLKMPSEVPHNFRQFVDNFYKSISATTIGAIEFPYRLIKSFTDPLFRTKGLDELSKAEAHAAWRNVENLGRFFGEPLGFYGTETARKRWLTDPAGSLLAVAPFIKGVRTTFKAPEPIMAKPFVKEVPTVEDWQVAQEALDRLQAREKVVEDPGTAIIGDRLVALMREKKRGKLRQEVRIPPSRKGAPPGTELLLREVSPKREIKAYRYRRAQVPGVDRLRRNTGGAVKFYGGPPVDQVWELIKNKRGDLRKYLMDLIDVEDRFKRIGAPETGHAVKIMPSVRDRYEIEGINHVKKVAKLARYDKKILSDAVFAAESKSSLAKAVGKTRAVAEYWDLIRRSTKEDYARRGITLDFEGHIVSTIQDLIEKAEDPAEAADLAETLKIAKDLNFVHIPAPLWLEGKLTRDPAGAARLLRLLAPQERKSLSIRSLVDRGLVKAEDVNIADIIASYMRRKGNDFAVLNVLEAARNEGLASLKPVEGYIKIPAYRSPLFAKYYLEPTFAHHLLDMTKPWEHMGPFGRAMVTYKMLAFWNALFLPMIDIAQQVMLTQAEFWKAPKYLARAARMIWNGDPKYLDRLEKGLASKPFNNPWQDYRRWVKEAQMRPTVRALQAVNVFEKLKQPGIFQKIPVLSDFYNASWNVAWALDRTIRLSSELFLEDKGFSPAEATKMAALYHADYASVPARTRALVRTPLFTPTFKITMGKLFYRMVRDAMRVMSEGNIDPKTGQYAKGLLAGAAVLEGWELFMTQGLGFRRDEWGRRYVKTVQTDQGDQEVAVTWSIPENLFLKYIYRGFEAAKSPTPFLDFFNRNKWEIHPIWRVAIDLLTGKTPQGEIIYDRRLDPDWKSKAAWYGLKELVRVINEFDPEETNEEGRKQFAKAAGQLLELAPRPFEFKYMRGTKEERITRQMQRLNKEFKSYIWNKAARGKEIRQENIDSYLSWMQRLMQEYEQGEKKR